MKKRQIPDSNSQTIVFIITFIGSIILGMVIIGSFVKANGVFYDLSQFLVLPVSLAQGMIAWQGFAFIKAFANLLTNRKLTSKDRAVKILPGAWVFLPVSLFVCGLGGILIGLFNEAESFPHSMAVYMLLGLGWGILLWQMAKNGLFPLKQSE